MRRVMIIGMSGAGKSTLCRSLSVKMGVPSYHLDNIYHLPGWVARDEKAVEQEFNAIAATKAWVVDGNYRRMSSALQQRAEVIVFLDFCRVYSVFQILKRWALHKLGIRKRVDLAEGFNEQMTFAFIKWVWNWPAHSRVRWMEQLAPHQHKVIILKNRRQIRQWLKTV